MGETPIRITVRWYPLTGPDRAVEFIAEGSPPLVGDIIRLDVSQVALHDDPATWAALELAVVRVVKREWVAKRVGNGTSVLECLCECEIVGSIA